MKKNKFKSIDKRIVLLILPFLLLFLQCSHKPLSGSANNGDPKRATIFKPAYIKATMKKVTNWQLNHPKHAPTDWTNGAFYAGVVAAYKTTGSRQILDSLMALGQRTSWRPGPRYDHADDIAIAQTYIDVYRIKGDRLMINPTIDTVQSCVRYQDPNRKKD